MNTLVNTFGHYSKKRYRFCGKEKDEETRRVRERHKQKIIGEQSGMYYYGARYYSPWLCRFISVDPLAGKYVFQSPYAYADNNPINKMDYNGEGTNVEGDLQTGDFKVGRDEPAIVETAPGKIGLNIQTEMVTVGDKKSVAKNLFPKDIVRRIIDNLGLNALKRSISVFLPKTVKWGNDCLETFNKIIQEVLFDKNQEVGDRIIGKGSTHEKLFKAGRASAIKRFGFNDKSGKTATGNATAFKLKESIGEYIKNNYNKNDGGVKVYGFSVLNGYHSMIITYGLNDNGEMEYNLFDQGPATSFVDGRLTFSSPKALDAAINEYVQAKQEKRTKSGLEYPATAELFLIKSGK